MVLNTLLNNKKNIIYNMTKEELVLKVIDLYKNVGKMNMDQEHYFTIREILENVIDYFEEADEAI